VESARVKPWFLGLLDKVDRGDVSQAESALMTIGAYVDRAATAGTDQPSYRSELLLDLPPEEGCASDATELLDALLGRWAVWGATARLCSPALWALGKAHDDKGLDRLLFAAARVAPPGDPHVSYQLLIAIENQIPQEGHRPLATLSSEPGLLEELERTFARWDCDRSPRAGEVADRIRMKLRPREPGGRGSG